MSVNSQTQVHSSEPIDFVLPDFTRLAWVSESARTVWEPRVNAIRSAWQRMEWLAVVEGVRACALTRINPVELPEHAMQLARYGLAMIPLGREGISQQSYSSTPAPYQHGQPFVYPVAIGRTKDTSRFVEAWCDGDHIAIGSLLSFPDCCSDFFVRHWVDENRVDTTWPMASATSAGMHVCSGNHIDIDLSSLGGWSNVLCRWLGFRLVPHLPCAFDCEPSITLGKQFADVGRNFGLGQEVAWIIEMLSWPMEWSARHGIAEIRLPVVKIETRSDTTAETLTVRLLSKQEPVEMESGLRFPYRNRKRGPFSATRAIRRSLEEHTIRPMPLIDQYTYRDNGFSSYRSMEVAQAPIIEVARNALKGQEGAALDLGCGNAILVEKICAERKLIPCGVDVSAAVVERASRRLNAEEGRFIATDLFVVDAWPEFEHFACVILMVGRLLEAPPERAERLIEHLKACTDLVILYKYAGYHPDSIETLAGRFELNLNRAEYTLVQGIVEVAAVPLQRDSTKAKRERPLFSDRSTAPG